MEYTEFLQKKTTLVQPTGIDVALSQINPILFPFQREMVRWALKRGKAALFEDTGLGKTFQQLEWARLTGQKTLILAPLSIARQTVREGAKLGIEMTYCRKQADAVGQISIANYEMMDHFDAAEFGAIVLDESSCLKGLNSKTRIKLTEKFAATPFKLCATATPAPNDFAEIGNHAEFLNVMTRAEMLATFFLHDSGNTQEWKLKGHAEEAFYRWLASWGMFLRKPSDLGFSDDGYDLPPLRIMPVFVNVEDTKPEGSLFFMGLKGIGDRAKVRKTTTKDRCHEAARQAAEPGQWLIWCGLNDESTLITSLIPGAVEVTGSDSIEHKEQSAERFQAGGIRVLVTKCDIFGFGLNFQNCHQTIFVGLSDSWESYYQCIRRFYRFGQVNPVTVLIVLSEWENAIYDNIQRKERQAKEMSARLIDHVKGFEMESLKGQEGRFEYDTQTVQGDGYTAHLGDSCELLRAVPDNSIDMAVYSPPFSSLYTYNATERDLGNSRTPEEFFGHYDFVIREMLRVTKPGRNNCVHVSQIAAMKGRDGYIGLKDFRGEVIRAYIKAGWIYYGEVAIDKNPQAAAIRTKSKKLMFVQLRKDSAASAPAQADYILIFQKPGENQTPVKFDGTNDDWIEWAHPLWYSVRETETLNAAEGRDDKDSRHICPLQLDTIERCVRLYSNQGEMVLSPFMGIGSEGYVALQHNRRFIGMELKPSYFNAAVKNLNRAIERRQSAQPLFAEVG